MYWAKDLESIEYYILLKFNIYITICKINPLVLTLLVVIVVIQNLCFTQFGLLYQNSIDCVA